jgi:hypothetical protein
MTCDDGRVSEPGAQTVDLVINTFERTYRSALRRETLLEIRDSQCFDFASTVVLVNNVLDPHAARALGEALLRDGTIDELRLVAEHLDGALARTGLTRGELEPLLHYSDGPLVAATLPGSPFFLYWDPEARLDKPVDWISPALELMAEDGRVIVANPSWEPPDAEGRYPNVEHEALTLRPGFAIGQGFSDQVFLARRAALAAPIYRQRCIASITYPAAHRADVFEARIAAFMRHNDKLRATSLTASYVTDAPAGSSYAPHGALEWSRYLRNALTLRALRHTPWRPACLRGTWL